MAIDVGTANEQGTKIIAVSFFEPNGTTAVTPNTVTWTLRTASGTVINSRTAESETPATTINVVLTGDDLAISSYGTKRYVRVYGTYDSATYGSNLNYQQEFTFKIINLRTLDN
jgi:hypothetical protein